MEAVSETGLTVILSSHIVAELERVCDHLVILARPSARRARRPDRRDRRRSSPADRAAHRRGRRRAGPRRDPRAPHRAPDHAAGPRRRPCYDADWELHEVDLEEIVLAYLGYGASRPVAEAVAS